MTLTSFLTGIADKLRLYLGGDKIPAQSFADKIDNVYEAGQKSEHDRFWDEFQKSGQVAAADWQLRFAGRGWNDETFSPKHDIVPTGNCYGLFWMSDIADLKGVLERCGVVLDLSQATSTNMALYSMRNAIALPEINVSNSNHIGHLLSYCSKLKTVDKLIVSETNTTIGGTSHAVVGASPFAYCYDLEDIVFEGTLACNGVDLQHSTKLSAESIESFMNVLSDTTSGFTVTLSLQAVNKAFQSSEGANDGASQRPWLTLVEAKPNWNISLI